MQYSLPQFVDVEDKIIDFPPLTIKQFLAFVACGLLCLIYWAIFNLGPTFFLLAIPTLLLGGIFAFAKFNGRPILANAPNLVHYFLSPKYRIFMRLGGATALIKHDKAPVTAAAPENLAGAGQAVTSRLKSLAYLLDQKSAEEARLLRTGQVNQSRLNEI